MINVHVFSLSLSISKTMLTADGHKVDTQTDSIPEKIAGKESKRIK